MGAVTATALAKAFGSVQALDGLTFEAEGGSMYGLIGPDGAGKSTFMRIAACLALQNAGTLTVDGIDSRTRPRDVKSIIGYMPQRFSLYPDLSVGENLAFFADLFGIDKKERRRRIGELLAFSRLEPFLGRRAGDLSGGMKQKLALSCTLIHTPRVLFLDEPTTGVDPVSRREFWRLLADIKAGGTTIVVSTPYMDEAGRCDRVGFILRGRIIAEGRPDDIPGRFTGTLLSLAGPGLVRRARTLTFPAPVHDVRTFGDRLHLSVDDTATAVPVIEAFLADAGIDAFTLDPITPSIEDVFMEYMTDEH